MDEFPNEVLFSSGIFHCHVWLPEGEGKLISVKKKETITSLVLKGTSSTSCLWSLSEVVDEAIPGQYVYIYIYYVICIYLIWPRGLIAQSWFVMTSVNCLIDSYLLSSTCMIFAREGYAYNICVDYSSPSLDADGYSWQLHSVSQHADPRHLKSINTCSTRIRTFVWAILVWLGRATYIYISIDIDITI